MLISLFGFLACISITAIPFCTNLINAIFLFICFVANLSLILLIFNLNFLAISVLIIYIGAIVVLFLFAIMVINLQTHEYSSLSLANYRKNFSSYFYDFNIFF